MLIRHANRTEQRPRLVTSLARNVVEVRLAQRLRYEVFASELGARVPGREQGIDCDIFDAHCDHLLVRDTATSEVVGTYRLLTAEGARRAGGFYSEQEFDLSALDDLRPRIIEAGRACVRPDYRGSAVLGQLWAGIVQYMIRVGAQYVIGCASVNLADGGACAASVCAALSAQMAEPPLRVVPRLPFEHRAAHGEAEAQELPMPPLMRTYLRLGAAVCGPPAWDPHFNTADFFILVPAERLAQRYAQRFRNSTAASRLQAQ